MFVVMRDCPTIDEIGISGTCRISHGRGVRAWRFSSWRAQQQRRLRYLNDIPRPTNLVETCGLLHLERLRWTTSELAGMGSVGRGGSNEN
jgi:hypothetical protein